MRYIIALVMVAMISFASLSLFGLIQEIPAMPVAMKTVAVETTDQGIQLSHKEHFYEDTIQIAITNSDPRDGIYFTLDGSQPSTSSEKYSEPIEIQANDTINSTVLRAIAVRGSKEIAAITHTYFIGKNISKRFSSLVVSLSTDPNNLYDYETGIFVEGKLRHDYILDHPDEEIFHSDPANYNLRGRLYERPVYVEMFEPSGKQVVCQKAGMRTHGGWARSLDQKSIRLIARNEYESGKGKFDYDFFAEDKKFDAFGSPIMGYDSLVLRNASNYEGAPMLLNEVASRLAQDAGFHETLFFRPAAVFLNGKFYGFLFLEQLINEKTLQESYSAPEPAFDIVGVGETRLDEGTPEAVADLEALNAYADKDLLNDQTFEELSKLLDIDNFLHYYALELYLGNSDWPHNNLKRWRYSGDVSAPNLHPYLDGRWRYILYDLDRTFGFMPDERTIVDRLLGDSEESSPMLKALLKRPEVAQQFLAILSELSNNVMSPDNVENVLNSVYDLSRQEVQAAHDAGKFTSMLTKDDNLLMFARNRWQELLPQVKEALGYTDTFELTIKGISKSIYPSGSKVSVTPKLSRYEVFDGWLVNGVPNSPEKIVITQQDIKNGQVLIEQLSHVELPSMQLIEVSETKNKIILRNNTEKVISTKGFYLTDEPSDMTRWAFTPMKIQPGETAVIVGKTISNNTVLFTPQLNFNIQVGETIILSDEFGHAIDYQIVEF